MWLNNLYQHWLQRRPATGRTIRPPATRRQHRRPTVEQLEDRTLLSNFVASNVSELIADINAANLAGGSNTISLKAGKTFTLTAVDNTTDGATGLPVIVANDDLTIVGNGDTIKRRAWNTDFFRLFDVAAGASLTLKDLTLQGGVAALGRGVSAVGGAIYSQGTLDLDGVTVQNNQACCGGAFGGLGGSGLGGGLYVAAGTVTLNSATFSANTAQGGSGGAGIRICNRFGCRLIPGRGGNGLGGAMYVASGTVTLNNTTMSGNTAQGGLDFYPGGIAGRGVGGGLYIAPAAIVSLDAFTQSNVINNTASTSDPDIFGSYTLVP